MYLRLVLSFVLTSPKFLHKALSRAYAERECMSLRSAPCGQLVARKSQHIIFEPPPSRELYSRASGGVCRSRACQLRPAPPFYKTPYNIFTRGTPMGCLLRCTEVYNVSTKTRSKRLTSNTVPYQQEKDICYPNSLRYLRKTC